MNDLGPRPLRFRVAWALLVASLVVTLPALEGEILGYDDQDLLTASPDSALRRSPWSLLTGQYYYAYLPVYGLSYQLDGALAGEDPRVFHFGNVLWHAATAYLVFCVLALLLGQFTPAFFGALLFAIHPLHVESVAWIAGRKELVSGFFLFLAWLLHLRRAPRVRWGVAVFVVACFAKASAIVLPGLLLAAALFLPRYADRRRAEAMRTLPYFVAALVPFAVHLAIGVHHGVVREVGTLGSRLLAGATAWGSTLWRTLLPFDLSIDYPESRSVGFAAAAMPLALLAAAVASIFWLRRRAPAAAFGVAAFLIALAPFNGVFPATGTYAADRYAYLALFGAAAVVAVAVARRPRAVVVAGVVALVLMGLSWHGASRFVSDEVLWTRTIAARDASALAWINRGIERTARAQSAVPRDRALLEEAIADLERGLQRADLMAHRARASRALIVSLATVGRVQEGLERADDALQVVEGVEGPDAGRFRAGVLTDRGVVYKQLGLYRRASLDLQEAARLLPNYLAYYEGGRSWLLAGEYDAAERALEKAAALRPGDAGPHLALARVYFARGQRTRYREALDEAAAREPGSADVVEATVRYWLTEKKPDWEKAYEELDQLGRGAAQRQRLEGEIELQRALYLFRRGDTKEAVEAADRALERGLRRSPNLYHLGQIYLDAGRYDAAISCYRQADDPLDRSAVYRDAIARTYLFKAYRAVLAGDEPGARAALRAGLEVRPDVLDAGAAPLRWEMKMLLDAGNADLLLLAVAAARGDPAFGRRYVSRLLDDPGLPDADRVLAYRLRALLRAFVTYDFEGAEEDLQQVLARDANDRVARFRLAQVYNRSGAAWLRTANQLKSEERRRQGEELIRRAIALLGELIAAEPGFAQARLERGLAHFSLDDLDAAKSDYAQVRSGKDPPKEVFHKEAVLHRLVYVRGGVRGTLAGAIELLDQALARDPNYFDALYEKGNALQLLYDRHEADQREAFSKALFCYRRAMALQPRAEEPRVEWASLCLKAVDTAMQNGDPVRAHQLLLLVEGEASSVPLAHKLRVRLNLQPEFPKRVGQTYDEVYASVERALGRLADLAEGDPELATLRALFHRTRALTYFLTQAKTTGATRQRAGELAVEELRRALAADPGSVENERAREQLRQLDPKSLETLAREAFDRGREAFEQRRFKAAADGFGLAYWFIPASIDLRVNYAVALARAGHLDRAQYHFDAIVSEPGGARYPNALYELAQIHLVRRNEERAAGYFQRYVALMDALGRGKEESVTRARAYVKKSGAEPEPE